MNARNRARSTVRHRIGCAAALGLAALLSACATMSPQERSAYQQAQQEVQQLAADPLANQAAGRTLSQARDSLANADAADHHHDRAGVVHWSYLASRQAETGEAMVAELRASQQVANSTAERNRLMLDYQRQRTEIAQQQAAQAQQRARSAEQQLQETQVQQLHQQQEQQLAQARQQAGQQVQQAEQQAGQQVQQARAAEQQAEQQAEQLRGQMQRNQQAQQQLAALQARQTPSGMVLTLSGGPLFATGRDTLEPGAEPSLQRVAAFLQQHPMVKVRIEGFTDSRGSDAYNDALSQRRAQAVAEALESNGVDGSRLQSIGRGAALPVASNNTGAGRQQNRRVELLFSDLGGQFASIQGQEHPR